jgi:hypothetical protein
VSASGGAHGTLRGPRRPESHSRLAPAHVPPCARASVRVRGSVSILGVLTLAVSRADSGATRGRGASTLWSLPRCGVPGALTSCSPSPRPPRLLPLPPASDRPPIAPPSAVPRRAIRTPRMQPTRQRCRPHRRRHRVAAAARTQTKPLVIPVVSQQLHTRSAAHRSKPPPSTCFVSNLRMLTHAAALDLLRCWTRATPRSAGCGVLCCS